jgi:hypothetical protein
VTEITKKSSCDAKLEKAVVPDAVPDNRDLRKDPELFGSTNSLPCRIPQKKALHANCYPFIIG